ncbi:PREDICTED: uncharacterized protein LOC106110611, partial [Papilio polytes]|uniref:uncharacterized protein LOC106110611 n=1 Tax=Papilio polytes TaxID=76194 RepID=UPI000675DA65
MPKCRACGKYAANADCLRCIKCTSVYHRACSAVPAGPIPLGFVCQGCKAKPADNMSAESSSPGDEITATGKGGADCSRMLCELIEEIKGLRSDLKEARNEMKQFKADLQACCSRITSVEGKVLEVEKKIDSKTFDNAHLENTIADLKTQLNERDQELLLNDVEIAGLPEERRNVLIGLKGYLKLGFLNVGSLNTYSEDFVALVERHAIDLMAVGETWLRAGEEGSAPRPAGYRFLHTPRPRSVRDGRGGGVGFFVKRGINVRVFAHPVEPSLISVEQMWLTLKINNKILAIGTAYRPPWLDVDSFFDAVTISIVEKAVWIQLSEYLETNNILPEFQSGFRKGHSTTTALLDVTDNIIAAQDDGMCTILVLLDFSRAFDCIDISLLLSKMVYYGFDPDTVSWFQSFLTGRGQCVEIVQDN